MRHVFVCVGVLFAVLVGTASAEPYKVYVFAKADADGFVDADSKVRKDSVADVKEALADKKYRDMFVIVESPEQADLKIEIMWRGPVALDMTTGQTTLIPGIGTAFHQGRRVAQNNLKLDVTVGDRTQTFWSLKPGTRAIKMVSWSGHAERAVKNIATWTTENRTAIASLSAR